MQVLSESDVQVHTSETTAGDRVPRGGYSSAVLQHFRFPRNVGEASPCDGVGIVESEDGIMMRFTVHVAGEIVRQVRFKATSCVVAVACCSALAELAEGRDVQSAIGLAPSELMRVLKEIPAYRRDRCELACAALRAAIMDAVGVQEPPREKGSER